MRCKRVQELLLERIDGPTAKGEEWAVDEHIESCAECTEFQKEIATTWRALDAYPSIEPSQQFLAKFYARLGASERPTEKIAAGWWPRAGWQWMALASCVLILACLLTMNSSQTSLLAPETGLTKSDQWDDRFLQDLDSSLAHWETSYVPAYDSWPDSLLDPSFQESPPAP